MSHRPRAGDGEGNVAAHVRFERELRGWSTAELARYITEAGCPMSQSAVWRIESGEPRRKISVDELIAFAKVFDKSIDDLLQPPTTDYPEDLIREYVLAWLRKELTVWHRKLDASVAFGDLARMLTAYPGAGPHLSGVIDEVMERENLRVVSEQVKDHLRSLPVHVSMESGRVMHMANADPLIAYWRRIGMTDEQMIAEANRLKLEGTLSGSLKGDILYGSPRQLMQQMRPETSSDVSTAPASSES